MPYDITQFSPEYGGTINSAGEVVNPADAFNSATGRLKVESDGGGGGVVTETATLQNAASALGNGTNLDVSQYSTLIINAALTGTATVTFEASVDGTTYDAVNGYSLISGFVNVQVSSISSANRLRFIVTGWKYFRARISAYTSGTVTVQAQCTSATMPFYSSTINTGSDGITSSGYNPLTSAYLLGFNGTTYDRVKTINTGQLRTTIYDSSGTNAQCTALNNDALSAGYQGLVTESLMAGFNGSTIERRRLGKIYKWIEFLNLADATATTVWTPAAGKKFRLMSIQISTSAAATVHLRDGAGGTRFHSQRTGGADTKDFNFGNGYLSSAANNVLEILNSSGATINVWVTAFGTEE